MAESLVAAILGRLARILVACFEVVFGVLKLVDLSIRQVAWIVFVVAIGLLLLWTRETFFDVAPSIASAAGEWVGCDPPWYPPCRF